MSAAEVADSHQAFLERFQSWADAFGYVSGSELVTIARDDDEDDERRRLAAECLAWLDDIGAEELSGWPIIQDALDVEVGGKLVQGGWELASVALLVSYGGPNVRYCVETCDRINPSVIRIEVAWWSDSATRFVECDLAAELDDYATELVAGAR